MKMRRVSPECVRENPRYPFEYTHFLPNAFGTPSTTRKIKPASFLLMIQCSACFFFALFHFLFSELNSGWKQSQNNVTEGAFCWRYIYSCHQNAWTFFYPNHHIAQHNKNSLLNFEEYKQSIKACGE